MSKRKIKLTPFQLLEWKLLIKERLSGLRVSPVRETEIIEELSQHLQQRFDELLREQQFPIRPVPNVEEAVPIPLQQQFARSAFPVSVDHHRRLGGVPVP